MNITKGKWRVHTADDGDIRIKVGGGVLGLGDDIAIILGYEDEAEEANANAQIIVTAVNACVKLNTDNPQAVAEGIPDLYEACGLALKLADAIVKQISGDNVEVLMARATIKKALAKAEGK